MIGRAAHPVTMDHVPYLIVGGGITGLSFANFLPATADWRLLEQQSEPGGLCRTVLQDGFVWDCAGHFLHFQHPDMREFLLSRLTATDVLRVSRRASVYYQGTRVDFPFQKNIHQLPRADFVECLHDLFFRPVAPGRPASLAALLHAHYGRAIAEKFLIPYNEKLYACSLADLDPDAMGRFFPAADIADIIRHLRHPENSGYNHEFYYPRGGAVEYVRALRRDLDPARICCREKVIGIDRPRRIVRTSLRQIGYDHLIGTMPFPELLRAAAVPFAADLYRSNQVLVLNLGFDGAGNSQDHWTYFPGQDTCFYRVGFYHNIVPSARMSLYVEIGQPSGTTVDPAALLPRVLHELRSVGIVTCQRLVSWQAACLEPAYVHITTRGQADAAGRQQELAAQGVHTIGRYGRWHYSSIEDDMLAARELARRLAG